MQLYQVLGLESNQVSQEEIRRAFLAQATRLHEAHSMQKGHMVGDHSAEYIKLVEAYNVLSNPRSRRLYDKVGMKGTKLLTDPTASDPVDAMHDPHRHREDWTNLAVLMFFLLPVLIYIPVIFALKCDGVLRKRYMWAAVWAPFWLFDLLLLTASIIALAANPNADRRYHNSNESASSAGAARPADETANTAGAKTTVFIGTLAFILLQIFIVLRLDQVIDWHWYVVFIPWYIFELCKLAGSIHAATQANPDHPRLNAAGGVNEAEAGFNRLHTEMERRAAMEAKRSAIKSIWVSLLSIWQAFFLAAKLDDDVDWNWGIVFVPIWAYLFTELIQTVRLRAHGYELQAASMVPMNAGYDRYTVLAEYMHAKTLLNWSKPKLVWWECMTLMAILLVCRLEVARYSVLFIMIPPLLLIGYYIIEMFCVMHMSTLEQEKIRGKWTRNNVTGPNAGYAPVGSHNAPTRLQKDLESGKGLEVSAAHPTSDAVHNQTHPYSPPPANVVSNVPSKAPYTIA